MKHNNDKYDLVLGNNNRRNEMSLFDPFFEDFFDMPMMNRHEFRQLNNVMKTDVKETDTSYILDVDVPGFDKKDINLELEDGYLTISAKHEYESNDEHKKTNFVRRERSYGSVSRSFYVGDVKQDQIDAKLEKGTLTITLPKQQKQVNKSNRIEIK